jgi:hypothetical protein
MFLELRIAAVSILELIFSSNLFLFANPNLKLRQAGSTPIFFGSDKKLSLAGQLRNQPAKPLDFVPDVVIVDRSANDALQSPFLHIQPGGANRCDADICILLGKQMLYFLGGTAIDGEGRDAASKTGLGISPAPAFRAAPERHRTLGCP